MNKEHVPHQPCNVQGEEGGKEQKCPYEKADDETHPKYPLPRFLPVISTPLNKKYLKKCSLFYNKVCVTSGGGVTKRDSIIKIYTEGDEMTAKNQPYSEVKKYVDNISVT